MSRLCLLTGLVHSLPVGSSLFSRHGHCQPGLAGLGTQLVQSLRGTLLNPGQAQPGSRNQVRRGPAALALRLSLQISRVTPKHLTPNHWQVTANCQKQNPLQEYTVHAGQLQHLYRFINNSKLTQDGGGVGFQQWGTWDWWKGHKGTVPPTTLFCDPKLSKN